MNETNKRLIEMFSHVLDDINEQRKTLPVTATAEGFEIELEDGQKAQVQIKIETDEYDFI